ncbi:MAG: sulfatase-like hydrolase/transferase [Planctomycetales bacterium]|nr:sulfatase-like hydrolase/transferase [Planctomycetales bacterium]MBN8624525.1 sulfatase-like hydrolase/transferase [Planctomycetota bacterium]
MRSSLRCVLSPAFALLATFAITAPADSAEAQNSKDRRPNIILILADDIGIPGIGCYGGNHKTPNIDALASGGIRFTHAYSQPLCGPTRATIMSGSYTFRNGVLTNGHGADYKPSDTPSIAKTLKAAGYATAVAGKWGQLAYFNTQEDGRAWGYDEFMIWNRTNPDAQGERYWDPAYVHNGKPVEAGDKYGPDLLHDFVIDFARRHKDGPFFVYYPTPLIHGPILHTPDSATKAKGAEKGKSGNYYEDNIAYLDKLVGKLVSDLDKEGLRENTLICFMGDNGSTGNGPFLIEGRPVDGKKGSMLEGGSRVALIANWKGTTPAGKVSGDMVHCVDFYATFAELAGATLPADVKFDSQSFALQLRGQSGTPRESVFVQLGAEWWARSKDWKLDQSRQLFSMKNSPWEQIPIAADSTDSAAAAARKQLQAALDELDPAGGKTGDRKGMKKAGKKPGAKKAKKKATAKTS